MPKRGWYFNPHTGGRPIPADVRDQTTRRIQSYAAKHYAGTYTRIDVRFRGALCYIDAYLEPAKPTAAMLRSRQESRAEYLERHRSTPMYLCRIRYFGRDDRWSVAYYTYSHERYEPCTFENGSFTGTPEEAFEVGALLLR
jgi:hypothetical protein